MFFCIYIIIMYNNIHIIKQGTVEIISEKSLVEKLKSGKPLRVKFGADPTAPDIHLGHCVILEKLRRFQELGHKVVFIIGDFTARIGDPSGQNETRNAMDEERINANAGTYQDQVFRILEREKTEVVFNSTWFDRMNLADVLKMSSYCTVAQMLARADFKQRFAAGTDISILEFLYPLLQAYDSVHVKADVEVGGTDQKFNLLMGRQLQNDYHMQPQVVITLPLLEGLDGVRKMSKSYGNYIGVTDPPDEMFGKIMSVSDELMLRYYELLTDEDVTAVRSMNPRDAKAKLAKTIVARFYGADAAGKAEEKFRKIFVEKVLPEKMETVVIGDKKIWVVNLLVKAGLVPTKNEAKRLIAQGGLKINGKKTQNVDTDLVMDEEYVIQIGKRKFKKVRGSLSGRRD